MTFERPEAWAWLALAVPIVVLHLRWRKRRRLAVSSLGPWRALGAEGTARRGMRRVEDLVPLALLLAALLGVVAAWSGPVLGDVPPTPTRLAIVLDASASMNATVTVGATRFDAARAAAAEAVAKLGPADEVVVWIAADRPRILVDPTRDRAAAAAALASAAPTLLPRGLASAVKTARQALRGGGALLVLTDAPGAASLAAGDGHETGGELGGTRTSIGVAGLAPAGETTRSDGIVGAHVDRDDPLRLVVRVRCDPAAGGERRIALLRGAEEVAGENVTLAPGAESVVRLPLAAFDGTGGRAEIRLSPPDAFPEDDAWRMLLPAPRRLRVAVVARGLRASPFLIDALRAMPNHVDAAAAKLAQPDAPASAFADVDVVLCDGEPPESLATDRPVLVFGAKGRTASPPRLWAVGSHPVLAGIDVSPLRLDTAEILDVRPTDSVLLDSDAGPVAVCGERSGARVVRFGFRPEATSLPLEPAFPLLVRNALEWLVRGPLLPPFVVAGEPIALAEPIPQGVAEVLIDGPGARRGIPSAVRHGALVDAAPYPPPGGPYDLRLRGLSTEHATLPPSTLAPSTIVQWTAPPGFALDAPPGSAPTQNLAAAVAALPDRSAGADRRAHLAPWCAAFAALTLLVGAALLRR